MIDINSPEFYTIAFVVAMALIALLMGRREKQPPSTHIVQLSTVPDELDADDILCLEPIDGGRIRLSRTGLTLGAEETINLVITIQEEQCTIIEKKSIKRRRNPGEPVKGEVTLKVLRPGNKYRIRYESQLTSAWASFTFDTTTPEPVIVTLRY